MRYAVHQGFIDNNPAANLDGVTTPPVKRHYPTLPLERLPELLSRVEDYHQGRELTRLAVLLTLHVFIRSSELRFARWYEIDFRNRIWTIPATREALPSVRYSDRGAKMRTPHIVPLSQQTIEILKQIRGISGDLELMFPSIRDPYKPMSENTVNKALRLMGYDTKEDVCGHGFRAMACNALIESGLGSEDAIERQMSHQERNKAMACCCFPARTTASFQPMPEAPGIGSPGPHNEGDYAVRVRIAAGGSPLPRVRP